MLKIISNPDHLFMLWLPFNMWKFTHTDFIFSIKMIINLKYMMYKSIIKEQSD